MPLRDGARYFPTHGIARVHGRRVVGIGAWMLPHRRAIQYSFRQMPNRWRPLRFEHINVREALALALAIHTWEPWLQRVKFDVFIDNKPVKQAVVKLWSRNRNVMSLVRQIALSAIRMQSRYWICWIPTDTNTAADALSRNNMAQF